MPYGLAVHVPAAVPPHRVLHAGRDHLVPVVHPVQGAGRLGQHRPVLLRPDDVLPGGLEDFRPLELRRLRRLAEPRGRLLARGQLPPSSPPASSRTPCRDGTPSASTRIRGPRSTGTARRSSPPTHLPGTVGVPVDTEGEPVPHHRARADRAAAMTGSSTRVDAEWTFRSKTPEPGTRQVRCCCRSRSARSWTTATAPRSAGCASAAAAAPGRLPGLEGAPADRRDLPRRRPHLAVDAGTHAAGKDAWAAETGTRPPRAGASPPCG